MVPTRDTNFDSGLYFKLLPCVRRPIPLFVEVSCGITSMTTDLHIYSSFNDFQTGKTKPLYGRKYWLVKGVKNGYLTSQSHKKVVRVS